MLTPVGRSPWVAGFLPLITARSTPPTFLQPLIRLKPEMPRAGVALLMEAASSGPIVMVVVLPLVQDFRYIFRSGSYQQSVNCR